MEAVGQIIREVLANGIDDSDNNLTFCLCDYDGSTAINYIPERVVLAGHDRDNDEIIKIRTNDQGQMSY